MTPQIRKQTAQTLLRIAQEHFLLANLSEQEIAASLETPKKFEHGHLAFPVFSLAKALRKAPPIIAQEFSVAVTKSLGLPNATSEISDVTPLGGFVNFTFNDAFLQKTLAKLCSEGGDRIGYSTAGHGRRVVIDYSSPNVAKPLHVGHLRATVIGQAIRNLAETQGYDVIGLNHLGDWGVQFGKLAWAYEKWASEYDFSTRPFDSLYELYVRFHQEAEKNPELEAEGSLYFRRLEEGDKELRKLWQHFVEISLTEHDRLRAILGASEQLVRGESFYNDRLAAVEKKLEELGLLTESEGCMVVQLGDEMPPCLIRKSDGASLYATRDLASAIYRHDELKADVSLYVVGVEQTMHFKQVFKVLELMGYQWVKNSHHIAFGMYRFKEGKMSTRRGRTVFLEDVIRQAIELVAQMIEEKNPDLPNKAKIAEQIGAGAIIFNDLAVDRVRDVEFDWEKTLSFDGDSGPYVQYTYVRCLSLIRKYAKPISTGDWATALTSPEERELIRSLLGYGDILTASYANFRPNILAQYLLQVCAIFSRFYNKHRILGEPDDVASARMALVDVTRQILFQGLRTLNIQAPEAM